MGQLRRVSVLIKMFQAHHRDWRHQHMDSPAQVEAGRGSAVSGAALGMELGISEAVLGAEHCACLRAGFPAPVLRLGVAV